MIIEAHSEVSLKKELVSILQYIDESPVKCTVDCKNHSLFQTENF